MTQRFTPSLFFFSVLCLLCSVATAQDIHYSQFYASPLTLNPALTGINDCSYRITGMYRNQWSSVPAPFSTPSISFDINSLAPKIVKTGNLAAGLLVYNDRSGDGHLNNLSVALAGGYSINPDFNKKHRVSVGIELGFTQKSIDLDALTFEDELKGNITTAEAFNKTSFGYLNAHAGLLWLFKPNEKLKLFLGGAAFNVNKPTESFLGDKSNKLDMRPVVHGGGEIGINEKLGVHPSVLWMKQAGSSELNLGTAISVAMQGNFNPKIFFGAYYRLQDAVIPVVGMDYRNFRVGLSYDVNVSSLNDASGGKGGFEVSLAYNGCISSVIDVEPIQWCPRF